MIVSGKDSAPVPHLVKWDHFTISGTKHNQKKFDCFSDASGFVDKLQKNDWNVGNIRMEKC